MTSGDESTDGSELDQPWSEQASQTSPGQPTEETPNPSQGEFGGQSPAPDQSGQMYDETSMAGSTSPIDVLTKSEGQTALFTVVGVFTIVGTSIGLALFLGGEIISDNAVSGSETVSTALTMLVYLGGPLLAVIVGLQGVTDVGDTDKEAYVLSFVSAAIGSVAMILTASIFASLVIFFFEFGDFITASILMAVPTGLAAVGVAWANR